MQITNNFNQKDYAEDKLSESEIYSRLQSVVGVNVMGFRLFPETAGAPLLTAYRGCCPEASQLDALTEFIIHFIEQEKEKCRESARRLRSRDMPISEIAEITDVTEEENQDL